MIAWIVQDGAQGKELVPGLRPDDERFLIAQITLPMRPYPMKQARLILCLLLAIVLTTAACRRDAEPTAVSTPPPATPEATASAIPEPSTRTDATEITDATSPAAAPEFDARAFAGTFAAPGTRLDVDADGGYRITERAESANADLVGTGTWTLQADGQHLLLDPESKSDPDRRYVLESNDQLRPEDAGPALRRAGE